MRTPRDKLHGKIAVYHCISRTVGGQFLFGTPEKEKFCRLMRKHAAFCQMQVLTHTVLSNHFHLECRAPARVDLSNPKLLAALKGFYGPKSPEAQEFQRALRGQKTRLTKLRAQYLARMGDVSVFMKELKQAFSRWFNRRHNRYGTLWAERFRSTVVEDKALAALVIAAYIDLNSFRAGLVPDPKEYRFSGYGEAVARNGPAREGLLSMFAPGTSWKECQQTYRKYLYVQGGGAGHSNKRVLDREAILKVLEKGGKLSIPEKLRCRIRYFTYGVVLGRREYVEEVWRKLRKKYSPKRKSGARKMKGGDWGGLMTMRDLQKDVIG